MAAEAGDPIERILTAWADELPEIAGPRLELAKRVARLAELLDAAARAALARLGLTDAEYGVLATLRRIGKPYELTPTELSLALLLSSGGTSNVMHRLVAAGLVERESDPADARSRIVRLTPEGVRRAEQAVRASVAAHEEVLRPLSEDLTDDAVAALRAVLRAVEPPARVAPSPSRSRAHRA